MEVKKKNAEAKIKEIRRVTRKKYSSEEKIRIVIEGIRGERIKVSVKDNRGAITEHEISIVLNLRGEPPVAAFTASPTTITEGESLIID